MQGTTQNAADSVHSNSVEKKGKQTRTNVINQLIKLDQWLATSSTWGAQFAKPVGRLEDIPFHCNSQAGKSRIENDHQAQGKPWHTQPAETAGTQGKGGEMDPTTKSKAEQDNGG